MPTKEKPDPLQIELLGAEAIVQIPNALAHLIHQASDFIGGELGFIDKFTTVYLSSILVVN